MARLPHDLAHNPQTMGQQQNPTDDKWPDDDNEWAELADPDDEWAELEDPDDEWAELVYLDDEEDVCEHCKYTGNIDCKVGDNVYYEGHRLTCGHPTYSGGLVIGNVPINDPCIPKETLDKVLESLRTQNSH